MSGISAHVGRRIRLYRKMKNITIEVFAGMINKSKAAVSKYENGEISIDIETSKAYKVNIGAGLLSELGEQTAKVCEPGTAVIISDSTVWPLYGKIVETSLQSAGFSTLHFVFPAGESSKNIQTYTQILNFLAENHITRTDCLVALGGGVVGDLTGFAAACYLRGVRFVQVPTTVLAAVDSSVGGKTAIDLPAGKNLAGAFCQPSLVLCDTDTLNTLPEDIFRDGCAEVIKYGVLYDETLFSELLSSGMDFDRESVICRCVQWKRDVVMEDERDTGSRMKLNLGHTIGHGVEAKSDFSVSHGQAVSIGMAIAARAAAKLGLCSEICCEQIQKILQTFRLPVRTSYSAEDLYNYTLSDKKRAGGEIHLIIPRRIGLCDIIPTPIDHLKSFIQAGL